MKKSKVSLLALTAIAVSATAAFAATAKTAKVPDSGTNYTLNTALLVTKTNPAPMIGNVDGLLVTTNLRGGDFGVVWTDGSGKIDGAWDLYVTNLSDFGPYTKAIYSADVSGAMSSVGKTNATLVKFSLKGNGYAEGPTNTGASTVSINFTSSGGIVTKQSLVGPFTTNVEVVLVDVDGTTNQDSIDHYAPTTNIYQYPGYTNVQISYLYQYSRITGTNTAGGTNTIGVDDYYSERSEGFYFGTPAGAAVSTNTIGTNQFLVYPLVDYYSTYAYGTNAAVRSTNTYKAYALSDLASIVAAAVSSLTYTNTTNITQYSFVTGIATNGYYNGGYSTTNISGIPGAFDMAYSNGWFEVDGALAGSVKSGKYTHKFDKQPAVFAEPHTVYSQYIQTSYITNFAATSNLTYVTNAGVVTTNFPYRTNFQQVVYGQSVGESLSVDQFFGGVNGKVIRFGKNLWFAMSEANGTGSVNTKKSTFTGKVNGVAQSRGSTLNFAGGIGTLLVDYHYHTNIVGYTNVAANPPFGILATNATSSGDYQDLTFYVTNGLGTTTVSNIYSRFIITVPAGYTTNSVPDGIKSFILSGKLHGQKLVNADVTNYDAYFPY